MLTECQDSLRITATGLAANAVAFLVAGQAADGSWCDYRIPGRRAGYDGVWWSSSDQWVTAYVGHALAEASGLIPAAKPSARRAANWLLGPGLCYEAGWGYHSFSDPDADSTAWALLLLRRTGLGTTPEAEAGCGFLMRCRHPSGGFATYPPGEKGCWSLPHADVTAPAMASLDPVTRRTVAPATWAYLASTARTDGWGTGYWWSTPHYHGINMTLLSLAEGRPMPSSRPLAADCVLAIRGPADVALAAAVDRLCHGPSPMTTALLGWLSDRRRNDGGWEETPGLRVPDQAEANPERRQARVSDPLADQNRFMTAANVLRAAVAIARPADALATWRPSIVEERSS